MDVKACDICGRRIIEPVINHFMCPAADKRAELCFYGFTENTVYMCPSCASAIQNAINLQRVAALENGLNIDLVEEKED